MTVSTRRVWRAAPLTRILVGVFAALAAVGIPAIGYLVYTVTEALLVPVGLGVLTVLVVVYSWRFGLYPSLRVTDTEVVFRNPLRTVRLPWEDVTLVAAGENGLVVATEEGQIEAWCIQKSSFWDRRRRRTRADRIVSDLLDLREEHDPPVQQPERGWRIRRARPDESDLLTRLERAASEEELVHVFPPADYPYPTVEVSERWRRLLRDRCTRVHILELSDAAVGFVAFGEDTVRHLGVVPEQTRQGYGSALLGYATTEIFAQNLPAANLWVLTENHTARSFYLAVGWQDTSDRRDCEFPPYPEELRMTRPNPQAPRRRRAD